MPADTLPFESPMLPPLVLRPPLGPRILRALVMLLATLLLLGTAGWSLLANGREGDIAGAARQALFEHEWLPAATDSPAGPLTLWLVRTSLNLFGNHELAARLPAALAMLAVVWFTLRIGECLRGTWHGFLAGMLVLCNPGTFTLGRTLTPAPLEAAFLTAAFYALLRGYQERRSRQQWFFLVWLMGAGGFFAGGWTVPVCLAATVLLAMGLYRDARVRLPALILARSEVVILLSLFAAIWLGHTGLYPPFLPMEIGRIAWWQLWLLFPWSLLLLPGCYAVAARLLLRPRRPLDWEEGLPLLWLGSGLAAVFLLPDANLFSTLILWPAFALWAAYRLEITPRLRLLRVIGAVGLIALLCLGVASRFKAVATALFPAIDDSINGIPDFLWPAITSVTLIAILAFTLFVAAALWLEYQHQRRFALIALLAAMIPTAYAFADTSAKFAPYFSCADLARSLNSTHRPQRLVAIDGSRFAFSSLRFYLAPSFTLLPAPPDPAVACALWADHHPFLITRSARLSLWEERLGLPLQTVSRAGASLLLIPANAPGAPPSGHAQPERFRGGAAPED